MKNILILTDFSDAAQGAYSAASTLAKKSNSVLHVMHTVDSVQKYVDMSLTTSGDPMIPGFEPELLMQVIEKQKEDAKAQLDEMKTELEADNLKVVLHLTTGDLIDDIQETVEKNNIDLLVMGTHGASGFREAFIGSNAQKVVRNCKVPVLTVREEVQDLEVDCMVFASDYLEFDINEQLPKVKNIAEVLESELHLLYVNTPAYFEQSDDTIDRMERVAEQYGLDDAMQYIYNDFNIDEGIMHYSDLVEADMIVLVTHGFKGLKRLISDHVSESVVNHSKTPVLVFHV